jgi:hypothetical protein
VIRRAVSGAPCAITGERRIVAKLTSELRRAPTPGAAPAFAIRPRFSVIAAFTSREHISHADPSLTVSRLLC